jgi:hypothetical protein
MISAWAILVRASSWFWLAPVALAGPRCSSASMALTSAWSAARTVNTSAMSPPRLLLVIVALTPRTGGRINEDRVLPVTLPVAAAWGRQQCAQPLPVIDARIAATARVHGITVVTRNVEDFELAGVQVLNPFAE